MSSYNIGQYSRSTGSISSYIVPLNNTFVFGESDPYALIENSSITITDPVINLSNRLNNNKYYYFKITITANTTLDFSLFLTDKDNESLGKQLIDNFTLLNASSTSFEFVVHPNSNYNRFLLKKKRTEQDYRNEQKSEIMLQACEGYELINLLSNSNGLVKSNGDTLDSIKRIKMIDTSKSSYNSPILTCINGETIWVTPNYYYDLGVDYDINFVGLVFSDPTTDKRDIRIDYRY